jgi:hypothetical protein
MLPASAALFTMSRRTQRIAACTGGPVKKIQNNPKQGSKNWLLLTPFFR